MIPVTKNNIHTTSHEDNTFMHHPPDNPIVVLSIFQPWKQALLFNPLSVWYYQLVPSQKPLLIYCAIWLMKCGDSGQALGMGHCRLPGFSESFNMWNHFISWPGYPRLLSTQTTCALDMQLPWAPRLITERHLSRKPGFAAQQLFFSSFSRVKFQPQLAQTPRSNPLNQEASRLGNRLWIGTLDFFPPFLPLADGCIPFAYTTGLLNPGSIKSFPLHLQEAWPNLLGLLLFFNLLYVNK